MKQPSISIRSHTIRKYNTGHLFLKFTLSLRSGCCCFFLRSLIVSKFIRIPIKSQITNKMSESSRFGGLLPTKTLLPHCHFLLNDFGTALSHSRRTGLSSGYQDWYGATFSALQGNCPKHQHCWMPHSRNCPWTDPTMLRHAWAWWTCCYLPLEAEYHPRIQTRPYWSMPGRD